MSILTITCCNCGYELPIEDSRQRTFCSACGAENIIAQDLTGTHTTQSSGVQNVIQNIKDVGRTSRFEMTVEDVFTITGRGNVATGCIAKGFVSIGDTVKVYANGEFAYTARVTAIEAFRKSLTTARAGENVGLMLSCSTLKRGDVLIM